MSSTNAAKTTKSSAAVPPKDDADAAVEKKLPCKPTRKSQSTDDQPMPELTTSDLAKTDVQLLASEGAQNGSSKIPADSKNQDNAVRISQLTPADHDRPLPSVTSNSLAFSAREEDALVERFGREAHEDGMLARRSATVSVMHVLETGAIIAKRFQSEGGDRKRGSKYGAWCATYLDWLGRKTCDRWRQAYHAFAEFLNDAERAEELTHAWENLQLTSLYKLSETGVPRAAKIEALERAKIKQVTPLMATAMIEDNGGKAVRPRPPQKPATHKVDASIRDVSVVVRYPKDGDKNAALNSAIERLREIADQAK